MIWLSPGGSGGFTGISSDAEICPGFRPPRANLASGEYELCLLLFTCNYVGAWDGLRYFIVALPEPSYNYFV